MTQVQKIAVLGGGVGAMATAFALSEQERKAGRKLYDITVYQMGWRLGGKGASGRNRRQFDRIEEHGLHIWFGYYHRAFDLMRKVYKALGRPAGSPLASLEQAFVGHDKYTLLHFEDNRWEPWDVNAPPRPGEPGGEQSNIFELLKRLAEFLKSLVPSIGTTLAGSVVVRGFVVWLDQLISLLTPLATNPDDKAALDLLQEFQPFTDPILSDNLALAAEADPALLAAPLPIPPARLAEVVELGGFILKGIIADKLTLLGFPSVDHEDMREWLIRHGASQRVADGDVMRVSYEAAFAFSKGSYHRPDVAAGTGIRNFLNLNFDYRGHFSYKMQAGMGDVVFAPIYLVLKQRGVKFAFFHKVTDIVPADDGRTIARIEMDVQAAVPGGDPYGYDPLYDVKGLPCWPSEPLYERLEGGPGLDEERINLESHWAPPIKVSQRELRAGTDFDKVVLGISLGALPHVAARLIEQKPKWKAMVEGIETIQTQAFQIWLNRKLTADEPVYGCFAQPHNTVANMSHLITYENWPAGATPQANYYFCGPKSQNEDLPEPTEAGFPPVASLMAGVRASQWLRSNFPLLLPQAALDGRRGGFPVAFDYGLLHVDAAKPSEVNAPFSAQYWRANIDPSERYVLSTKGSVRYRLKSDGAGYANMVLAGDWTQNGINIGCVEAAVASGLQAAEAIRAG